ncbi:MAG: hypothetical protein ACYCR9_05805 [Cuniculiplasma sp.]
MSSIPLCLTTFMAFPSFPTTGERSSSLCSSTHSVNDEENASSEKLSH